ncbi:hypothetical protein BZA05DRAFT_58523 [Tricharina praecox]|uniref:uncharacterized protein n=1 Tax=Tricharina praecox TaxID=43433 RepID=UPI0022209F29|nr:uncharacterized protein BZA05DRAFT_58523 [Tricharina praecox]KAI5850602.1 hypothetical protein BZA05DRAFT_58523 [Tricharina praecox]
MRPSFPPHHGQPVDCLHCIDRLLTQELQRGQGGEGRHWPPTIRWVHSFVLSTRSLGCFSRSSATMSLLLVGHSLTSLAHIALHVRGEKWETCMESDFRYIISTTSTPSLAPPVSAFLQAAQLFLKLALLSSTRFNHQLTHTHTTLAFSTHTTATTPLPDRRGTESLAFPLPPPPPLPKSAAEGID